jgi:hypothetical protein
MYGQTYIVLITQLWLFSLKIEDVWPNLQHLKQNNPAHLGTKIEHVWPNLYQIKQNNTGVIFWYNN